MAALLAEAAPAQLTLTQRLRGTFGADLQVDELLVGEAWWVNPDGSSQSSGAVRSFRGGLGGWALHEELVSPHPLGPDTFGASVARSGALLLVGALNHPHWSDAKGGVFAYRRVADQWVFEEELQPSDAGVAGWGWFGESVAIEEDLAAVGSLSAGVTFFHREGSHWVEEGKVPGGGENVALFGEHLVFKGWFGVEVFRRAGGQWVSSATLPRGNVAFDGNRILATTANGVIFYRRKGNAWEVEQEVTKPTEVGSGDQFGSAMSLRGDVALVATRLGGGWRGRVYVLSRDADGWSIVQRVSSPDGDAEGFANSVELGARMAVIEGANEVFVYRVSGPSAFYTLPPCRLVDTREIEGGTGLLSGASALLQVVGKCGIPPSAEALALNVTVVGATAAGRLTLSGATESPAAAQTNLFAERQTRATGAVVGISSNGVGELRVLPELGEGQRVHVILDVNGYFE
jgi:hypothetical protein